MAWCEDHVNGCSKRLTGKQSSLPEDYAIDHDWQTTRTAYQRRGAAFIHHPDARARLSEYLRWPRCQGMLGEEEFMRAKARLLGSA